MNSQFSLPSRFLSFLYLTYIKCSLGVYIKAESSIKVKITFIMCCGRTGIIKCRSPRNFLFLLSGNNVIFFFVFCFPFFSFLLLFLDISVKFCTKNKLPHSPFLVEVFPLCRLSSRLFLKIFFLSS